LDVVEKYQKNTKGMPATSVAAKERKAARRQERAVERAFPAAAALAGRTQLQPEDVQLTRDTMARIAWVNEQLAHQLTLLYSRVTFMDVQVLPAQHMRHPEVRIRLPEIDYEPAPPSIPPQLPQYVWEFLVDCLCTMALSEPRGAQHLVRLSGTSQEIRSICKRFIPQAVRAARPVQRCDFVKHLLGGKTVEIPAVHAGACSQPAFLSHHTHSYHTHCP
jgi:hypothetical protein